MTAAAAAPEQGHAFFNPSTNQLLLLGGGVLVAWLLIRSYNKSQEERRVKEENDAVAADPSGAAALAMKLKHALCPYGDTYSKWNLLCAGTDEDLVFQVAQQLGQCKVPLKDVAESFYKLTGGYNLMDDLRSDLSTEDYSKFVQLSTCQSPTALSGWKVQTRTLGAAWASYQLQPSF